MRINHNISALYANNQLNKNGNALSKSLEKLSSGNKINRAADDAAGMAISEKMRTQIAALDRASQNAADGISVIQTAEGALSEVESMLQRMRELSVQASNGTITTKDRSSIQDEIDQLNQEIKRISDTTEFNTKTLLDGSINRTCYTDDTVSIEYLSDSVAAKDYKIIVTQDPRQAVLVGNATTMTSTDTISDSEEGSITINGTSVDIKKGDSLSAIYEKIRDAGESININVFGTSGARLATTNLNYDPKTAGYDSKSSSVGNSLAFVSDEYGSDQTIKVTCTNSELAAKLGLTTGTATAAGVDAELTLGNGFDSTATVSTDGNKATVTDRDGFKLTYDIEDGTAGTIFFDAKITSSTAASSVAAMMEVTHAATQATYTCSAISSSVIASTVGQAGTIDINGYSISVAATDTVGMVYSKLQTKLLVSNAGVDVTYNNNQFSFTTEKYGVTSASLTINCSATLATALGFPATSTTVTGTDAIVSFPTGSGITGLSTDGKKVSYIDAAGNPVTTTDNSGIIVTTVLEAGAMELQIGANEGQTMKVTIPKINPETLGIANINIETVAGAEKAISTLDDAIDEVSAVRAKLGAYQNRLEHSIANLDTTSQNMTEAISRIKDTDMAAEMATYTQMQVLSQAGTSMLAQANQRPQTVLTLLQG